MAGRQIARNRGVRAASVGAWAAVGAYGLFLATSQLLWLTYAPVTGEAHAALGVSEGAVGDLAVVVPLFYIVLGLPSGRWLDRRFRSTLAAGTILTVVGALIRAVDAHSYQCALVGQVVLAAGQPLVTNAVTKLPARLFVSNQRTAAISALSAAQFAGILVAASTASWLVGGGIGRLVGVHAVVASVAGLALLASLWVPPRLPADAPVRPVGMLIGNRQLWFLGGQMFIGFGLFNSFATWIDSIESDFGNEGLGGLLVTVMTVGGIVGAATIPSLAARRGRRRETLIVVGLGATVLLPLFLFVREPALLVMITAIVGLLLMAGMPLALDWSEVLVGGDLAATAAGFLFVVANLGATLYVLIVQVFLSDPTAAIVVLTVLVAPWVLLAQRQPSLSAAANVESSIA